MVNTYNSAQDSESDPVDNRGQLMVVSAGAVSLPGILHIPADAHGLVIIAHGIAAPAQHPRRNAVAIAHILHQYGLATFQVTLFTSDEYAFDQETKFFRNNTDIMHQRLFGMADWFSEQKDIGRYAIGYVGLEEAGEAALKAALSRPDETTAVVAVGSQVKPSLSLLGQLPASALYIVGAQATAELTQNKAAVDALQSDKQIFPLQDAASLSESLTTVAEIARQAGQWMTNKLVTLR